MTENQVRELLLRRIEKFRNRRGSIGLRPWCKANAVAISHASEFLNGKRLPTTDLLDALGLEWRIVRKHRTNELAESEKPC